MTIKMLVGFSGADFSVSPNEETDRFSADEERRMIEAGYAEAVEGGPVKQLSIPRKPKKKAD